MVLLDERYVSVDASTFVAKAEALNARLQSSANPAESRTERNSLRTAIRSLQRAVSCSSPKDTLGNANARLAAIKILPRDQTNRSVLASNAALLYERALELDNLAEEIHRELMRCYLARLESADTVRVFRRCRELLSLVLGVMPSEATQTLYRQALAETSPP